jgi:hypothetical protein
VRIVPYYFVESGGKRMVTTVESEDSRAAPEGLKRAFIVYDALGGQYDSDTASPSSENHLPAGERAGFHSQHHHIPGRLQSTVSCRR